MKKNLSYDEVKEGDYVEVETSYYATFCGIVIEKGEVLTKGESQRFLYMAMNDEDGSLVRLPEIREKNIKKLKGFDNCEEDISKNFSKLIKKYDIYYPVGANNYEKFGQFLAKWDEINDDDKEFLISITSFTDKKDIQQLVDDLNFWKTTCKTKEKLYQEAMGKIMDDVSKMRNLCDAVLVLK